MLISGSSFVSDFIEFEIKQCFSAFSNSIRAFEVAGVADHERWMQADLRHYKTAVD